MKTDSIALINYTQKQEKLNCVTHIAGAIMGAAALIICVARSLPFGELRVTAAAVIYGISLIVMYSASAVYHGLSVGKTKKYARIIDHSMVFIAIAGTATPCSLVTLYQVSPFHCILVFSVAWLSAAAGIIATVFFFNKSSKIRMILLLTEGVFLISSVLPISNRLNTDGYSLLWLGCAVIAVGAVLFGLGKKNPYLHTVFHIFILLGTAVHFYTIAKFVFCY